MRNVPFIKSLLNTTLPGKNEKQWGHMTAQVTRHYYWKGRYPVTSKKLHTWNWFVGPGKLSDLSSISMSSLDNPLQEVEYLEVFSDRAVFSCTHCTARRLNLRNGVQSRSDSPTPNLIYSNSVCNHLPHLSFRFSHQNIVCVSKLSSASHSPNIPSDRTIIIRYEKHKLLCSSLGNFPSSY